MNVLITGGAGVIGRRLAVALLQAGHDVVILDLLGPNACHAGESKDRSLLWGDGGQTRDFVFVDDVARAFVLALETEGLGTQAINVGTGIETSFRALVDLILELSGRKLECRYSDARPGLCQAPAGRYRACREGPRFRTGRVPATGRRQGT